VLTQLAARFPTSESTSSSNTPLLVGTVVVVSIHIGAMHLSPTQFLLGLEPVAPEAGLRILVVAATVIVPAELHKRYG